MSDPAEIIDLHQRIARLEYRCAYLIRSIGSLAVIVFCLWVTQLVARREYST